jgi:hypothetical protein
MLTVLEIKKSIIKKNIFRHGSPFFGLAVNCRLADRQASYWSWKALTIINKLIIPLQVTS